MVSGRLGTDRSAEVGRGTWAVGGGRWYAKWACVVEREGMFSDLRAGAAGCGCDAEARPAPGEHTGQLSLSYNL